MIARPSSAPARAVWLSLAAALVLLAALAVVYIVQHRGDSDVLPPDVVRAVEAEKAARPSLDSAIGAERYRADMANAERVAAEQIAQRSRRAAELAGRRADSLAREAAHAVSARDSAIAWHLAYAARTVERDTLLVTIAHQDTALSLARAEGMALRTGLDSATAGMQRARSAVDATVASVRVAECRVPLTFGLVHCMSRTHAAIAGILVGVGGMMAYDAIRDGRLKITMPVLGGR